MNPGKIEESETASAVIAPGQGLSMFIERVVRADFHHLDTRQSQCGKGELARLAQEKGYADVTQIHWFRMTEGKVMPVGLEVVFDDDPRDTAHSRSLGP